MELVIDIGNTMAKLAVFESNDIVLRCITPNDDLYSLEEILRNHDIGLSIVSTVAGIKRKTGEQLKQAKLPTILLDETTVAGYNNRYGVPPSMGSDRLAAIVEARATHPGRNILVIDNGSCITYEFISESGKYLGGNISPGIQMRLNAMHTGTALLPAVNAEGETPEIGYDTETAMRTGCITGTNYEVEGYIRHTTKRYPNLITIISGGATTSIDTTETEVVFDHDLVIKGLRRILLETTANGTLSGSTNHKR